MTNQRPYSNVLGLLNKAGLRPTRQRLALGRILFEGGARHVTAEQLHDEAVATGVAVSLATAYNALHQFTAAGLLREVMAGPGRSCFDTNVSEHHHLYFEDSGVVEDIPASAVTVSALPQLPAGTRLSRVDVVVRVKGTVAPEDEV